MEAFDRYFFTPIAKARLVVLMRVYLLLLGFDTWILMASHGGRYGVGGFNVAHFPVMDALLPTPTPAIYVGTIISVGALCIISAIVPYRRWLLGLTTLLYTYSWAMSMLDSYQHHYFSSWVLLGFTLFPSVSTAGACANDEDGEPARVTAWGYVLIAFSATVVYGYTAITKLSDGWLSGEALKRVARVSEQVPDDGFFVSIFGALRLQPWFIVALLVLAFGALAIPKSRDWRKVARYGLLFACLIGFILATLHRVNSAAQEFHPDALDRLVPELTPVHYLQAFAQSTGFTLSTFWRWMGRSVAPLQVLICAGYLLGPTLDRRRTEGETPRWLYWLMLAAFAGAFSFHVGAEFLELRIGWFSFYMMLTACVFMLPARDIQWVAKGIHWFVAKIGGEYSEAEASAATSLGDGAPSTAASDAVTKTLTAPETTSSKRASEAKSKSADSKRSASKAPTSKSSKKKSKRKGKGKSNKNKSSKSSKSPAQSPSSESEETSSEVIEDVTSGTPDAESVISSEPSSAGQETREPEAGHDTSAGQISVAALKSFGVVGAVAMVVVGYYVDLPGSLAASVVGALSLLGLVFTERTTGPLRRVALAGFITAASLWISFALTIARFDYYRYVGGDHRRRGEYQMALDAYVKANRYAPAGRNRKAKEREMRERLREIEAREAQQ